MKKKIITLSLIGILLISLLSGCGKSEDKEAEKSTEPETESKSDTEEIQGQAGAAPKYIWESA